MLVDEVDRLFATDEQRILISPDGSQSHEDAPFDPDALSPTPPIFVESRNEGGDDFDYVLVAFRDRLIGNIPLIVTCLMRDGVVVPTAYSTYPLVGRPPRYPFLSPEEARTFAGSVGIASDRAATPVFYRSPVSPTPILFVYEFIDRDRTVYVSQDGAVWHALSEMNGPFY
jgi:hypothetical protein